ncbi:MAG: DHH family phosphoesterase [archaeon]
MALTKKEISEIRKELETSTRPLFFFDADPDGLCSFLLFYRFVKDGRGIIIKSKPILEEIYANKVDEFCPDKVFILDKPLVSQEFLNKVSQKKIWLDHHEPQNKKKVVYYNPRIHDDKDNRPTSYWCYQVVKQDLWIAMVGTVGDWHLPDFKDEFIKDYPDLLPKDVKTPETALFETKLGHLIRVFSFNLKGKTEDVKKSFKIMTRLKDPYEVLNQTTAQGRFVYKRFERINEKYEELKKTVKVTKDPIIVFTYKDVKYSFTGDLSNELLYRYPDKVILIAREKSGEFKCSIRSAKKNLPPILKKALEGVKGYGGGHEHACGACVDVDDFERFVENLKTGLK